MIAANLDRVRRFHSGHLLTVLLFVAVFALAALPPLDPDLFWHLANGRLLALQHAWPSTDTYSFTAGGHAWVMHEWLADLFMYGLFQLGGLPALVAVFSGLITAGCVCLYRLLRSGGLASAPAAVLTLTGALSASTTWGARPQVLNFLLTGILLLGLRAMRVHTRWAFALVPFLWLWANLHSGFVAGVVLALLFAAGEWIDGRRAGDAERARGARTVAIAAAGGALLALINPYGMQTILFPLGTLTSPLIQNTIQEWASPDFHSLPGLLLEAQLVLLLLGLGTRAVRASTHEWLWALSLLVLALASQRNVPLFVVGAAPLLGRCAHAVLDQLGSILPQPSTMAQDRVAFRAHALPVRGASPVVGIVNLMLLVVLGSGMVVGRALPNLTPTGEQASIAGAYPVATTVALTQRGPQRVFNDYGWGGYLDWVASPSGTRVFIDGRVEAYPPAVFQDYLTINSLAPGWEAVFNRYHPDAVLLPSGHPLVLALRRDPAWRVSAQDRVATLLTRVPVP